MLRDVNIANDVHDIKRYDGSASVSGMSCGRALLSGRLLFYSVCLVTF